MKILLTAPSLDEKRNVSGISSVVRQIIERGNFDYRHFIAGRQDGDKADGRWILKQLAAVLQFRQAIRREKIDIVHINTALNPLAILRDAAFAKVAEISGRKLIIHLHGGKFLAQEFENKYLAKIAEKMLRRARFVLVLSDLEKKIVMQRWKNLPVAVLENAVAIEEFTNSDRNNVVPTFIFLGRLHESKGLHEIIAAVQILKNEGLQFNFRCFGAGNLKNFFTGEMTRILGTKFYFGGIISGAEKSAELQKADIFLLPSRYGEGLPMAMLEAMASGCLVVVSKIASVESVVQEGCNGFLVAPQNTEQLVEKLNFVLANYRNLENVRENARKTVAEKYALENYIEKLEKIYVRVFQG